MPRFRCTLAYDGTDFHGSQIQSGRRTVQGELERTCRELGAGDVSSIFAGRTDRGVHAVGQVVAIDLERWRGGAYELRRAFGARLPIDMATTDVAPCGDDFNPRFDATWREYRYWIAPGASSPFLRRYAWTPRGQMDVAAIDAAARRLVGAHDFASFASGGEGVPWSERASRKQGTRRHIYVCGCRKRDSAGWPGAAERARVLEVRVAADGFLPQMVRNIVGALAEVGLGRRPAEWVDELLAARDRRNATVAAPPQGLALWRVGYDDDDLEDW